MNPDSLPIADIHTHPLIPLYYFRKNLGKRQPNSHLFPYTPFGAHIDIPRLKESGVKLIVCCVYAFNRLPHRNCFENAKAQIALFERLMIDHADTIAHAKSPTEVEPTIASGRIAAVLALEGGHHVAQNLDNLDYFQKAGIFYITLVHFTNTAVGECCHFADFSSGPALRPFGRLMITEMNRRGIVIDVAHSSERAFWDIMECSKTPPLYTHGGARPLCDRARNLSDEQAAAIAKAGGLLGVIFYPGYLKKGSFWGSIDDIIRHLEHWLTVAGPHALAIGSDMNGVMVAKEIAGYDKIPLVREAVVKAFGEPLARKILFENALDYMKRVWTQLA